MKKVEELKQGDVIYDIVEFKYIKRYKYLCVHPTGGGKYHILIDSCEEPIRIYVDRLQEILNLNLESYEEAKFVLINKLEDYIKNLKEDLENILTPYNKEMVKNEINDKMKSLYGFDEWVKGFDLIRFMGKDITFVIEELTKIERDYIDPDIKEI